MRVDDPAGDRKPKPRALVGGGGPRRGAAEGDVEHARKVSFRDAAAFVFHREVSLHAGRTTENAHGAAVRCVPDRVGEQVHQHSGYLAHIDVNRYIGRVADQSNVAGDGEWRRDGYRLRDDVGEGDALAA